MKKLFVFLFVLGLLTFAAQAASLKNNDVVGKWKYNVETPDGNLTGIIKITEINKTLEGEVNDDMGNIFILSKVVVENNELTFELQPDNEVIKVKAKLVEKKLVGTVSMQGMELKLVAEKQ